MPTKFDDYLREIEEKIKAEGPEAVARWEAFNTHFAMAHDESEISCADGEVEGGLVATPTELSASISYVTTKVPT